MSLITFLLSFVFAASAIWMVVVHMSLIRGQVVKGVPSLWIDSIDIDILGYEFFQNFEPTH